MNSIGLSIKISIYKALFGIKPNKRIFAQALY